ncbi:GNAT family N-acetyltransferase [Fusibacter paucivorans]|uniref:GNAT family N-acetyltransferase n=1 Tax=Fusibacter paucivorans TaxID=76009 RepID=A0ABS5PTK0_9FIRM|nr:GNAT family N-acetyltransferase [Fusibacter paucivorans]MBS7528500.1 GNAT family N-acetyltransferase [Fusibacter paucivorans]
MHIISVREEPTYEAIAIAYFQEKWANENTMNIYQDCISSCMNASNDLPQWYLMIDGQEPVGCAGLITNDFISRMDLYPWICALYIEKSYRGHRLGFQLLEKARSDAARFGFEQVYLCTDHIGFYEKDGFKWIGNGYHPWGESSRIYQKST